MKPANALAVMAGRQPTEDDDPNFFPSAPCAGRVGGELVLRLDPRASRGLTWEPACGAGHLSYGLGGYFPRLVQSDAYAYTGERIFNFLDACPPWEADWIITNPPFDHLEAFIELAWIRARRGVAMLLPARVLEGVGRHSLLYRRAPYRVFAPFSERVCLTKGRWDPKGSTAAWYAWVLWLKPGIERRPPADPSVWDIPPGTLARLTRPDDAARFGVRGEA